MQVSQTYSVMGVYLHSVFFLFVSIQTHTVGCTALEFSQGIQSPTPQSLEHLNVPWVARHSHCTCSAANDASPPHGLACSRCPVNSTTHKSGSFIKENAPRCIHDLEAQIASSFVLNCSPFYRLQVFAHPRASLLFPSLSHH